MHGPTFAALAVALCLGLARPGPAADPAATGDGDAVGRARALLAKGDPKGAVDLLEEALPRAGADLGPMIVVLRQAYTKAADAAARTGRPAEADEFRENLQILNRRMRARPDDPRPDPAAPAVGPNVPPAFSAVEPTPAPVAAPSPPPATPEALPVPAKAEPSTSPPPGPLPLPEPAPIPAPAPMPADVPRPGLARADRPKPAASSLPRPLARPAPAPDRRDESVVPAGAGAPATRPVDDEPTAADILLAADSAYLAGRYLDAGKSYAMLATRGELPPGRKLHWAYCRSVDIVRRIKAKPATSGEWASIDREIGEIKALSPKYWYADYLRNRADDQSRGVSRGASRGRVVRGAMPESDGNTVAGPGANRVGTGSPTPTADREPSPSWPGPPLASKPAGGKGKRPGEFAMAIPPTETPPEISTHGDSGNWQVKQTANFAIYHADPDLADRVARAAEATREAVSRKWAGSAPSRPWGPKCEIYLYPTADVFAQVTGQPAESPGFSTMEGDGTRITARRVKLRADHPTLIEAVLPHEVTHVVLADLFPSQQIPRWADEGIAVLSEPTAEQARRAADLDAALDGGKIFSIEHLMVRDYPEGPFWGLYYAQSISLTSYLVDLGTPAQFIDFLKGSQRKGTEAELRRVYGIDGHADLQARWLAQARKGSAARLASAKAGANRR